MRDRITDALKIALKAQDRRRISTLRLIIAAVNDRDIALRGKGKDKADEEEILEILGKMIKQREESSRLYREGGRPELEKQEMDEIAIIREYMPQPLSDKEVTAAIEASIRETGASSLRDMGKAMAYLKEHFRGRIDMAKAGPMIKSRLGA
ncbi:MAG: GatB/YqeY domain-containing protein [Rhizobiaceae bacterium]